MISDLEDAIYLEIGSYKGSTVCAAIANNRIHATCIDNWSEFGGPKETFEFNIQKVKSFKTKINVINDDFRNVTFDKIQPKANVFLFDGPHTFKDQLDGILYTYHALQDSFVLIVDDYNWHQVREGTQEALKMLKLTTLASITIRTNSNNTAPDLLFQHSDWHNGYFLAVLEK